MYRTLCASAAVTLACALASAPAAAQTADHQNSMQGSSGKSLSRKLSESGGVIKPKGNIDPSMHVPAPVPHPNSTPVIPPSATGGNSAK